MRSYPDDPTGVFAAAGKLSQQAYEMSVSKTTLAVRQSAAREAVVAYEAAIGSYPTPAAVMAAQERADAEPLAAA